AAILRAELDRVCATPGHIAVVAGAGHRAVVAALRPLAWDSAFFGITMARLDILLRGPAAGAESLRDAVRAVIDGCRNAGILHVTARVDAADLQAVSVLEDAGFRLMDALVSYFTHPHKEPPRAVRVVGRIRALEPQDVDEVLAVTREAYRGFRGRFQVDPHLPADRADEFYLEWARQCLSGRMADRVVVADDGQGGIYGWASTRRVEPASSVGGTTLWIGSLGACRRDMPGAYAGLIRSLAMANFEAGEVTETQTQNHNISTVRIYEAVGAKYVRGDYTFHAWLG
ncbi:MAG: hypothetical protein OEW19_20605, partial [Acidobacteriota bacterium]|nr:hypothetical protein [Acidobacteriota bacterium]